MMSARTILPLALLLLALPASGQQPAAQPRGPQARPDSAAAARAEPRLVFDREVFTYPQSDLRDPFQPLRLDDSGPQFDELTLRMIVYSPNPSESMILVQDAGEIVYRLRRGDSVGSATVVDIGRTRVVFSISEFGMQRQEVLDLNASEGDSR